MSTLKTTYIQHPDSENPQILLSASGMVFSASVFQATGGTLDLPSITTIAGNQILTQSSASATYLTQAAASAQFSLKANLISPALTGIPTAPTATSGTNTTQVATTAYSFEASSSASANADTRALSYANSASANVDTRALGYATSASANANVIASATYLTQAAASVTYLTQENVPPSQYKAFSMFLSGM